MVALGVQAGEVDKYRYNNFVKMRYPGNYSEEVYQAAKKVSDYFGWPVNWQLFILSKESNFIPSIENPGSGASGLWQFMPSTALALGTTVEAVRQMTPDQQADLAIKYLKQFNTDKVESAADAYALIFYPAMVGKGPEYKITGQAAIQNPLFDLDGNQEITKAEFDLFVKDKYLADDFLPGSSAVLASILPTNIKYIALALLLTAILYFIFKKLGI